MTDQTNAAAALPADLHDRLATDLKSDAHALVSKIEATSALTESTTWLENAKRAIVSAVQYVEAHFEALALKIEGNAETAEGDVKADAAKAETAVETAKTDVESDAATLESDVKTDAATLESDVKGTDAPAAAAPASTDAPAAAPAAAAASN